jgi:hypothetical protein
MVVFTKSCSQVCQLFRHVTAFKSYSHVSTVQHTCCIRSPQVWFGPIYKTFLHCLVPFSLIDTNSFARIFRDQYPAFFRVCHIWLQNYLLNFNLNNYSVPVFNPSDSIPVHFVILLSVFTFKLISK